MLNVISTLFSYPHTPRDRQAVDLLETHFPEQVQAVRQAKNRADACRRIGGILKDLEEEKKLSESQQGWLAEWLECTLMTVVPEDERIGPHFS